MSRSALSQPQRTQNNPLLIGTFSQTSLRYLRGTLGAQYKPIGRADTSQTSNGGIGGGTYNHWFQVTLAAPGWIILTKGPPRPKYIQVSAYDLNRTPIQGNPIFDADSIHTDTNGSTYIPYLDTVMSSQSDLYNTFQRLRLDRGDDRYYPLNAGSYLICVSSTRNETLEYELAVVIEFPVDEAFFELEDTDGSVCLQETEIDAAEIVGPITINFTISVNSFSETSCAIDPGVTVTVDPGITWYIGERIPAADYDNFKIILEVGNDAYYDTIHDHSLSEWQNAWNREHQDTDKFPELLVPLTNRP
jgi:hypothetical protein